MGSGEVFKWGVHVGGGRVQVGCSNGGWVQVGEGFMWGVGLGGCVGSGGAGMGSGGGGLFRRGCSGVGGGVVQVGVVQVGGGFSGGRGAKGQKLGRLKWSEGANVGGGGGGGGRAQQNLFAI